MVKKKDDEEQDKIGILNDQITELRSEMDRVSKPYEEMVHKIDVLNEYAQRYLKLLGIIASHGTVSPVLAVPDVKDSISKEIITVLAEKNRLNISQLADEIRERRGSSSRRIVRDKLKELVGKDYVTVIDGKIKEYSLAEEVVRKWSQLLTGLK